MLLIKALEDAMQVRKLSARKLGKLTGIPHQRISAIRKGENVSFRTLETLFEFLGLQIIEGAESPYRPYIHQEAIRRVERPRHRY